MVGNAADAALAMAHAISGDTTYLYSADGSTREAYLINEVIYKVENGEVPGVNSNEVYRASLFSDVPGARVPGMTLYGDVLACEFVTGKSVGECPVEYGMLCDDHSECIPNGLADMLNVIGYDTAYGNIILSDGIYWLVDIALL